MPRRTNKNKSQSKTIAYHFDLYRKVVISFVVLVTILILVVLYFSFVSAKITVVPKPKKVIADFTVNVVEKEDSLVPDQLNGVFFAKDVAGEKEFAASGSQSVVSDIVGQVTIYNNYRRPQPLVATTRLLSPDNILLHTKARVDVPVGSSVAVEVYADDPSQLTGRILAAGTRLTLPGLWPQLQDKIYAEAKTPIKVGENKVTVVTAEDIEKAKQELLSQLETKSFMELGLDGKLAKTVEAKIKEVSVGAEAGQAVEKFTVKIKARVEGVILDRENLIRLAEKRLQDQLTKDERLFNVNYDTLKYSAEELNLEKKTAKLKVYLEGTSVIRLSSDILSKDRLKGLTKEQVKNYFKNQSKVESAIIDFFPFWVRTVPQLPDHIEVLLKQN